MVDSDVHKHRIIIIFLSHNYTTIIVQFLLVAHRELQVCPPLKHIVIVHPKRILSEIHQASSAPRKRDAINIQSVYQIQMPLHLVQAVNRPPSTNLRENARRP